MKRLKSFFNSRPKTIIISAFIVGLAVGQLKPIDFIYWKIAEEHLPSIKAKSLAEESPFTSIPKGDWILESQKAFVIECDEKVAPYHFLVIPKTRIDNFTNADPETLTEMFDLIKQTVNKFKIKDSGFRLVINTNRLGGQTVYHLHMHIIAGRQMKWPPG